MAGQVAGAEWRIELLDWDQAGPRALPLRIAVFVDEQSVPADIEHDHWDARCRHALAIDAAGLILGTGRLLPDGHIGRMAVARSARGRGVGTSLLRALVAEAAQRGQRHLQLNAQLEAAPFYARHGFAVSGPQFIEAGIIHVPMCRDLPQQTLGKP